jgi:hypothetical protein
MHDYSDIIIECRKICICLFSFLFIGLIFIGLGVYPDNHIVSYVLWGISGASLIITICIYRNACCKITYIDSGPYYEY